MSTPTVNRQSVPNLDKFVKRDQDIIVRIKNRLTFEEALAMVASMYGENPKTAPAATNGNHKPANPGSDTVSITKVEFDRNWTWLTFDAKPSETIRDALKKAYPTARYSSKRDAWYIQETVSSQSLRKLLGIKVVDATTR